MQKISWQKITDSKVVLLIACLLVQQCVTAQTSRYTIPGYVSHEHVPAADAGTSAAAAGSIMPGQNYGNPVPIIPVNPTNPTSPASVAQPAAATSVAGYASSGFLATTTSVVEGYSITDYKGLVEGASVRVPTWAEDSAAGSQEVYGGSIASYAQLCEEARTEAYLTLVKRAKQNGANAVIGIHFDSQVMPLDKGKFATGVVCVGTAVTVKRKAAH